MEVLTSVQDDCYCLLSLKSWNERLRFLFNISKLTWPPGSPSISQSLPIIRNAHLVFYPEISNPGTGLPFSLYNLDVLVTCPFQTKQKPTNIKTKKRTKHPKQNYKSFVFLAATPALSLSLLPFPPGSSHLA